MNLIMQSDSYKYSHYNQYPENMSKMYDYMEARSTKKYPKFVIRPDSGEPVTVIKELLKIIEKNKVKFTINEKGYKVLNKYSIIWGDGITVETIERILKSVTDLKWSADNFAFGSGGDLMQNVNRDDLGFSVKCSSITLDDGHEIDNKDGTLSWYRYYLKEMCLSLR